MNPLPSVTVAPPVVTPAQAVSRANSTASSSSTCGSLHSGLDHFNESVTYNILAEYDFAEAADAAQKADPVEALAQELSTATIQQAARVQLPAPAERRHTYRGPQRQDSLQSRRGSPTDLLVPGMPRGPSRSPSPEPAVTPLTEMERQLGDGAEGIAERLKMLAMVSNTSLYDILRRLSDAERRSALMKQPADKAALDELVKRYPQFADLDMPAALRLELPAGSWEHCAESMIMGGITPGSRPSTGLYWRAHARAMSLKRRRVSLGLD